MSGIRRQSLISSAVIYAGFSVGLLNIYLFTKQGIFEKEQFGLYNAFIAVAWGSRSTCASCTFRWA